MGRTVILSRKLLSAEEKRRREQLTQERIRGLNESEMRGLLEHLMSRNESTGILIHAQEYVDRTAMNKI